MAGFPNFYRLTKKAIRDSIDDCDLTVLTTLISPRIAVVAQIKVGDILVVAQNGERIEVTTAHGEVCGSITASIERIKACIEKGSAFDAKVILINKAECQVLIQKIH